MNYAEACASVGYDRNAKCPIEEKVTWFAYRDGNVTKHDTREAAKIVGRNIERTVTNKADIEKWWNCQRALASQAFDVWFAALKDEYVATSPEPLKWSNGKVPETVFSLCYDKAYEDNHSEGYDSVAQKLEEYVDFALKVWGLFPAN